MGHHDHHHTQEDEHSLGFGYGVPPPVSSHYPPVYPIPYAYSPHPYTVQPLPSCAATPGPYSSHHSTPMSHHQIMDDHHQHARNEHLAETGALAAGAFAMYEAHEAKVDPIHAQRHKMEAGAAGAFGLGSAAYALHEHHEKRNDEHLIASFNGYEEGYYSHGHNDHHYGHNSHYSHGHNGHHY